MTTDETIAATTAAIAAGYRAFRGASGWYAARERRDGTHRQPPSWAASCYHATAEAALTAVGERIAEED